MIKVKKHIDFSQLIIPIQQSQIQFCKCHWYGHTCIKNLTNRQKLRYKDTCQINWLGANRGWDTWYNIASRWRCEKPILKKVLFEKKFIPILTL